MPCTQTYYIRVDIFIYTYYIYIYNIRKWECNVIYRHCNRYRQRLQENVHILAPFGLFEKTNLFGPLCRVHFQRHMNDTLILPRERRRPQPRAVYIREFRR